MALVLKRQNNKTKFYFQNVLIYHFPPLQNIHLILYPHFWSTIKELRFEVSARLTAAVLWSVERGTIKN